MNALNHTSDNGNKNETLIKAQSFNYIFINMKRKSLYKINYRLLPHCIQNDYLFYFTVKLYRNYQ